MVSRADAASSCVCAYACGASQPCGVSGRIEHRAWVRQRVGRTGALSSLCRMLRCSSALLEPGARARCSSSRQGGRELEGAQPYLAMREAMPHRLCGERGGEVERLGTCSPLGPLEPRRARAPRGQRPKASRALTLQPQAVPSAGSQRPPAALAQCAPKRPSPPKSRTWNNLHDKTCGETACTLKQQQACSSTMRCCASNHLARLTTRRSGDVTISSLTLSRKTTHVDGHRIPEQSRKRRGLGVACKAQAP